MGHRDCSSPPSSNGPVPWSKCRSFHTPFNKNLIGKVGRKHCPKWAITQIPFGDTGSAAFCLGATAEWEEEGFLAQSCWQWRSPNAAATAAVVCSPATTALFSFYVPTTQPTHPPAFLGKVAEPELCSLPLSGTLLSCILGPRAPHCSLQGHECQGMSSSHAEFFQLWNTPDFLNALDKDETSNKAKEP